MQHDDEAPGSLDRQADKELIAAVEGHREDAEAARAAARELARRAQEGPDYRYRSDPISGEVSAAMTALVVETSDGALREDVFIALAEFSEWEAAKAGWGMVRRHGHDAVADRLLAYFSGVVDPGVDELVSYLVTVRGFRAVLAMEALAARGAAAVPAIQALLAGFPIPARQGTGNWMGDETTKFFALCALERIGPPAAPTTPLLVALLQDHEGYRDTRFHAQQALVAIGLPETAEALIAELRPQTRAPHGVPLNSDSRYQVLETLGSLPQQALLDAAGLDDLVAELLSDRSEWVRDFAERIGEKRDGTW